MLGLSPRIFASYLTQNRCTASCRNAFALRRLAQSEGRELGPEHLAWYFTCGQRALPRGFCVVVAAKSLQCVEKNSLCSLGARHDEHSAEHSALFARGAAETRRAAVFFVKELKIVISSLTKWTMSTAQAILTSPSHKNRGARQQLFLTSAALAHFDEPLSRFEGCARQRRGQRSAF